LQKLTGKHVAFRRWSFDTALKRLPEL